MRDNRQVVPLFALGLIAAVVVLTAASGQDSSSVGTYQIAAAGEGNRLWVQMVDTRDGTLYHRDGDGQWRRAEDVEAFAPAAPGTYEIAMGSRAGDIWTLLLETGSGTTYQYLPGEGWDQITRMP